MHNRGAGDLVSLTECRAQPVAGHLPCVPPFITFMLGSWRRWRRTVNPVTALVRTSQNASISSPCASSSHHSITTSRGPTPRRSPSTPRVPTGGAAPQLVARLRHSQHLGADGVRHLGAVNIHQPVLAVSHFLGCRGDGVHVRLLQRCCVAGSAPGGGAGFHHRACCRVVGPAVAAATAASSCACAAASQAGRRL